MLKLLTGFINLISI